MAFLAAAAALGALLHSTLCQATCAPGDPPLAYPLFEDQASEPRSGGSFREADNLASRAFHDDLGLGFWTLSGIDAITTLHCSEQDMLACEYFLEAANGALPATWNQTLAQGSDGPGYVLVPGTDREALTYFQSLSFTRPRVRLAAGGVYDPEEEFAVELVAYWIKSATEQVTEQVMARWSAEELRPCDETAWRQLEVDLSPLFNAVTGEIVPPTGFVFMRLGVRVVQNGLNNAGPTADALALTWFDAFELVGPPMNVSEAGRAVALAEAERLKQEFAKTAVTQSLDGVRKAQSQAAVLDLWFVYVIVYATCAVVYVAVLARVVVRGSSELGLAEKFLAGVTLAVGGLLSVGAAYGLQSAKVQVSAALLKVGVDAFSEVIANTALSQGPLIGAGSLGIVQWYMLPVGSHRSWLDKGEPGAFEYSDWTKEALGSLGEAVGLQMLPRDQVADLIETDRLAGVSQAFGICMPLADRALTWMTVSVAFGGGATLLAFLGMAASVAQSGCSRGRWHRMRPKLAVFSRVVDSLVVQGLLSTVSCALLAIVIYIAITEPIEYRCAMFAGIWKLPVGLTEPRIVSHSDLVTIPLEFRAEHLSRSTDGDLVLQMDDFAINECSPGSLLYDAHTYLSVLYHARMRDPETGVVRPGYELCNIEGSKATPIDRCVRTECGGTRKLVSMVDENGAPTSSKELNDVIPEAVLDLSLIVDAVATVYFLLTSFGTVYLGRRARALAQSARGDEGKVASVAGGEVI